jgi:hypothetical protein
MLTEVWIGIGNSMMTPVLQHLYQYYTRMVSLQIMSATYSKPRICISFTVQQVQSKNINGIMKEWTGMLMFNSCFMRISSTMNIS